MKYLNVFLVKNNFLCLILHPESNDILKRLFLFLILTFIITVFTKLIEELQNSQMAIGIKKVKANFQKTTTNNSNKSYPLELHFITLVIKIS